MAGGSGTRLWPASSSALPKQFLPAAGGKSFFAMAVERAFAVVRDDGTVIVIAGKSHIPHVLADVADLPTDWKERLVVIGEPVARNTAPAVACAVRYSLSLGEARRMLVLTSDHIIQPAEAFNEDASKAWAKTWGIEDGKLVVFGIRPTRPDTGYGYIYTGGVSRVDGLRRVWAFHEKPDPQTAKKYAASKRFFWNSGMFAFPSFYMEECFRYLAPEVYLPFEALKPPTPDSYTVSDGVRVLDRWAGLDAAYRKAKSISFDYAIAEKALRGAMIEASFDWIDIGNWEEYAKIRPEGGSSVFAAGNEGETCFVDSDIPVALAGVEDLIVAIRAGKNGAPAVALVTRKGQAHKVRDVVTLIRESGRTDLL